MPKCWPNLATLLILITLLRPGATLGADEFVLIQSGESIGRMSVSSAGQSIAVKYRVDDNGRGAKLQENIDLAADGLPHRWRIQGNAWFGAPVNERFQRRGDRVTWQSLNDRGESRDAQALYLPNDSSPWAYGLYLARLLQTADRRIRTAPSGELRLEKIRDSALASPGDTQSIALYALWGLDVTPTYLVAAPSGEYLGFIAPGFVFIASTLEPHYQALSDLAEELDRTYLTQLTKRLAHSFSGPYWIRNVRIWDSMTGMLGESTNVVILGDRIVGIRSDDPPVDAPVIDGAGGSLLPGLHDLHTHTNAWSGPLHIAAGVTRVRDMGNDNASLLTLRARIDSGENIGPRISMRGFLEGRSPFSSRGGFVVSQLPAALEKVQWYANHGFDGIKIYNSMTSDWVGPIAAEAKRLGLRVSGHVPAFMQAEQAMRAGYDEINHINQLMLSFVLAQKEDTRTTLRFTAFGERVGRIDLNDPAVEKVIALMKERQVTLDPTLQTTSNFLLGRPGLTSPSDRGWLDHVPAPLQRTRRVMTLDIEPTQYAQYEASWKTVQALLLKLHRAGIRIVPGTDDIPGFALHSELEVLVGAGLTPIEALQAATHVAAQHLGNGDREGRIAIGANADMILVDGDPTQAIANIRRIRMTIKGGVVYYPEDIYRAMGIRPFAAKPQIHVSQQ